MIGETLNGINQYTDDRMELLDTLADHNIEYSVNPGDQGCVSVEFTVPLQLLEQLIAFQNKCEDAYGEAEELYDNADYFKAWLDQMEEEAAKRTRKPI